MVVLVDLGSTFAFDLAALAEDLVMGDGGGAIAIGNHYCSSNAFLKFIIKFM